MYGSECYAPLVGRLPAFVHYKRLETSAIAMQRAYRGRLLYRFLRVSRTVLAEHKAQRLAEERAAREAAAGYIQRRYRGNVMRAMLREFPGRSPSTASKVRVRELQERQAERDRMRILQRAARKLQAAARIHGTRRRCGAVGRRTRARRGASRSTSPAPTTSPTLSRSSRVTKLSRACCTRCTPRCASRTS